MVWIPGGEFSMGSDTTYKVHLDGYNNLDYWTGKSEKSAGREIFYDDETDLMAIRVDGWKMHIGVKHHGIWFDEKSYPSVPYVVNLGLSAVSQTVHHGKPSICVQTIKLRLRQGP